jgi:hypothetical protein
MRGSTEMVVNRMVWFIALIALGIGCAIFLVQAYRIAFVECEDDRMVADMFER